MKNINCIMKWIVEKIDRDSDNVQINFNDESWRKNIPTGAGWYRIITNTPICKLCSVGPPKTENKKHINIPETINSSSELLKHRIAIRQHGKECYVVYNGEAKDLRARAREHENGSGGTSCLGLSNYESLHDHGWVFSYLPVSECKKVLDQVQDDKLLRVAVEQGWRVFNGWPILCRK